MNKESKLIDSASKLMEERRGNCAQAIFAIYAPHLENGKLDFETCMQITSAFGGGINLTGNVCGAITGALMTLGLKYGMNFQEVTKVSAQLLDDFRSQNGSILCRDLVGPDIFDDENLRKKFAKDIFNKCLNYVVDVARLLEKHVTFEGEEEL